MISGIMIATRAFPLGLKNNPIIQRISPSNNKGSHNRKKMIVINKNNHTMLQIIHMSATVFLGCP